MIADQVSSKTKQTEKYIKSEKILVVDDEHNTRKLIAYHVEKAGYNVTQAINGAEAIEILKQNSKFDLMVVDVMMPKMDGYTLCKRIREEVKTKFIPFIFLSAKYQVHDKVKGLEHGADDYLTKPFHPEELLARIKLQLSKNSISEDDPFPCPKCHTKGKIRKKEQASSISSINFQQLSNDSFEECDLCNGTGYTKEEYGTAILYKKSEKYRFGKRMFDIAISLIGITLTALLYPAIALIIKLNSRGPVVYKQTRIGVDRRRFLDNNFRTDDRRSQNNFGKPFAMYKFRSMYTDAEKKSGPVWAKEDDPRITKVGKFLRKTRIDELPQFINILKGDMSFVGPRPERVYFGKKLAEHVGDYNKRFKSKPGLTGIAQILDGYDTTIEKAKEKVTHDIGYVKNKNLFLDMNVIFRTIKVILTGEGAH